MFFVFFFRYCGCAVLWLEPGEIHNSQFILGGQDQDQAGGFMEDDCPVSLMSVVCFEQHFPVGSLCAHCLLMPMFVSCVRAQAIINCH